MYGRKNADDDNDGCNDDYDGNFDYHGDKNYQKKTWNSLRVLGKNLQILGTMTW